MAAIASPVRAAHLPKAGHRGYVDSGGDGGYSRGTREPFERALRIARVCERRCPGTLTAVSGGGKGTGAGWTARLSGEDGPGGKLSRLAPLMRVCPGPSVCGGGRETGACRFIGALLGPVVRGRTPREAAPGTAGVGGD